MSSVDLLGDLRWAMSSVWSSPSGGVSGSASLLSGEPGVGARELCCPGVAPDVVRRPSARCSGPRTPADALCGLGFSCADARDTCPSLSLLRCSSFRVAPCGGALPLGTLLEPPSSSCTWGSSLQPPDGPRTARLPGRLTHFPSSASWIQLLVQESSWKLLHWARERVRR